MGKGSVRDVTPGPVEVQGDAAVLRAAAAGEDADPSSRWSARRGAGPHRLPRKIRGLARRTEPAGWQQVMTT